MSKTWAAKKKKKSQIKNRLSCFTESPADETSSNFNSDRDHTAKLEKRASSMFKISRRPK